MRYSLQASHVIGVLAIVSAVVTLMEIPRDTWFTTAALSMSAGVAAAVLMAAAAVLGGRIRLIESAFGGLDRVYLAHKWLGIWALAFASVHFAFKAGLPSWETQAIITLPAPYVRLARQLSFLALMLIILLALNRKIPYHVWRWWHKLSGPLFLIVILHWLSFKSPIALDSPAGRWLTVWSAAGVLAATYKLLLYPLLSKHAEYRVISTSKGGSGLHLVLAPVRRAITFTPGQFAFLSMKEDGLREPHPFTIARGPDAQGRVDFVIRDLGDYTHRLMNAASVGMHANVYAPFGRFARPVETSREIWIAGGVGISPFISWLDDTSTACANVTLFYFFTPGREFPSAAHLSERAQQRGVELQPVSSGPTSANFTRRFAELARDNPDQVHIAFCGPKGLLAHVQSLMRQYRIPKSNLSYEYFDFR